MSKLPVLVYVVAATMWAQSLPLESVAVTGTAVPKATVLEIAQLTPGKPVDKAAIEAACARLGDSGVFSNIQYRYKPGPNKGYEVALALQDQTRFIRATIDVSDVDETRVWNWLSSRFPAFDRRVPAAGAAQDYLTRELEGHLEPQLHGHHLVSQLETDVGAHAGGLLSFHPDVLPPISALNFSGEHEVSEAELRTLLSRVVDMNGYMERRFRRAVEENFPGLYEQHGMYRAKFPGVKMEHMPSGDAVTVTTYIEEGPQYKLGTVQFSGEGVDQSQLEKAGQFKTGQVANWREIDLGIDEGRRALASVGYLDASANPARVFDDERHVLSLRVAVNRGPLYRLGKVEFNGLTPELEAKAREAWKAETGAPYEARYATEFYTAFAKSVNVRQFKKWVVKTKKAPGNVVDLEIGFIG